MKAKNKKAGNRESRAGPPKKSRPTSGKSRISKMPNRKVKKVTRNSSDGSSSFDSESYGSETEIDMSAYLKVDDFLQGCRELMYLSTG